MFRRSIALPLLSLLAQPLLAQTAPPAREITIKGQSLANPMVSADGQWIVAESEVDNQERKLVVRRVSDGEFRALPLPKARHRLPLFTAAGDRIVFLSTVPRRSSSDSRFYLMSVPFDRTTGTTTGDARQISLDGVSTDQRSPVTLSRDGQWVAYVECCTDNDLRVVPISGGNVRTLAKSAAPDRGRPGWLSWSADSKSLLYHTRIADTSWVRRVTLDGRPPVLVSRFIGNAGPITADQRYMVISEGGDRDFRYRIRRIDGSEVGTVPLQNLRGSRLAMDGRTLVGYRADQRATLRAASVETGEVRTIGTKDGDDWPNGWSDDGSAVDVYYRAGGTPRHRVTSLRGEVIRTIDLPADATGSAGKAGRYAIFRQPMPGKENRFTLSMKDGATGAVRELARDVLPVAASGPGGHYYGWHDEEWPYRQIVGERVRLFGVTLTGTRRLIADLPANVGLSVAYHGTRVAYPQTSGDSTRLQYIAAPGRAPQTLLTLPANRIADVSWSFDGRRLAVGLLGENTRMYILQFDAQGNADGEPRTIEMPVDYYYELFWLRDNSGLSMIAQPKGARFAEVAIVKLSDPQRLTYVARSDSTNKWGHLPSPDGKWIAYPSERIEGTVVRMMDVSTLLQLAQGKR